MCWTDFPPGAPPSEVLSIWRVTGKPFRFRCKLLCCFFLFYVLVFNTFVLLALYVCFHILVNLTDWPPIGKLAAHSAYEMFSWYKYLIVSLVFSHFWFLEWNSFSDCDFS